MLTHSPIGFLFPGQGSQRVGMLDVFQERFPLVRETLQEADEALGESFSKLIQFGPEEKLKETQNAQPAILTASVAIGRILEQHKIRPFVLAGHSLGEYSALVLAQALPFSEAVRLVRLRGQYMQEVVPLGKGTMSAILGAEDSLVEKVCFEISKPPVVVEPANYNCPGQLVISGTLEGVSLAVEELKKRGVKKCIPLMVSAPFHCSLLKPAGEKLNQELQKVTWKDPLIPYVANVDFQTIQKAKEIPFRLMEQVWKPVRWTQTLEKMGRELTCQKVVEVGPGKVLSGHWKKVHPSIPCFSTDSLEMLEGVLSEFS